MDMNTPVMTVDGAAVPVRSGQNLLEACLTAGNDVPYFCWHPALGAVGACRQCAVLVFDGPADTTGRIVMACMTPATAGLRASVADPRATAFREQVLEMVLTNHPHDCPVCEVGGECHLQDMTVLTGHATRRYRFPKRTHLNQDLGPFIKHEMNRCIGCYRCLRFYRDYAGGDDFGVFGAARNVYFGRAESGALESAFAGNLVEVCPTGVFVDKPFSATFRRKWDMRATPSVCPHCAHGCNMTVNERGGLFRRVVARANAAVNGYFLCDRGRFGAGFVAAASRLPQASPDAALRLAAMLRGDDVIGIGSPRASVEANFALRKVVGEANFYAGVSAADGATAAAALALLRQFGRHAADLRHVEAADAVLVLGDDPAAVAPLLGLGLRQAGKKTKGFVVATPLPSLLDAVATRQLRATPAAIRRLGFAVARAIAGVKEGDRQAAAVASLLRGAESPLLVVGGAACGSELLAATGNILAALHHAGVAARFCVLLPEANSLGLAMLGAQPLMALPQGSARRAVVLENDLTTRATPAELLALQDMELAVLDHVVTAMVARADLVVPVGSFAETSGSFVNAQGRAQRYFKAVFGAADPPASWTVLRDAGIAAGRLPAGVWHDHAAMLQAVATDAPELAGCVTAAPMMTAVGRPASLPRRYSGRTAETADQDVREAPPLTPTDSPFGTTMEGPPQSLPGISAPLYAPPGWNSVQAAVRHGPMDDGGVLLFADADARGDTAVPVEPADETPPGLQFVAAADVFGADALAALAPAVRARIAPPWVVMTSADAAARDLQQGDAVICDIGGASWPRMLLVNDAAASGVAAMVVGLSGEPVLPLGCAGEIRRATT